MPTAWALVRKHERTDQYFVLAVALDKAFFCSAWAEIIEVTKRVRCSPKQVVGVLVRLNAAEDEIRREDV